MGDVGLGKMEHGLLELILVEFGAQVWEGVGLG